MHRGLGGGISAPIPEFPAHSNDLYYTWYTIFGPVNCDAIVWSTTYRERVQLALVASIACRSSTQIGHFPTELYPSRLRCYMQRSKSSNLGRHKTSLEITPQLKVCTSPADSHKQTELLTTTMRHADTMGCDRTSGAPGSTRRRPETTPGMPS